MAPEPKRPHVAPDDDDHPLEAPEADVADQRISDDEEETPLELELDRGWEVPEADAVEQALEVTFLPNFEGGLTEKDPNCERGTVRAMIASRFSNNQP